MTLSSYAANAQVFINAPSLTRTFADGTSNTITFAEHYAYMCAEVYFLYDVSNFVGPQIRRATFADGGPILNYRNYADAYPLTQRSPPVSTAGQWPGESFQVAPRVTECDPTQAQTPHRGGMLVALGDGSVRTLAPGMSLTTYWGAVTPAAGEILANDW